MFTSLSRVLAPLLFCWCLPRQIITLLWRTRKSDWAACLRSPLWSGGGRTRLRFFIWTQQTQPTAQVPLVSFSLWALSLHIKVISVPERVAQNTAFLMWLPEFCSNRNLHISSSVSSHAALKGIPAFCCISMCDIDGNVEFVVFYDTFNKQKILTTKKTQAVLFVCFSIRKYKPKSNSTGVVPSSTTALKITKPSSWASFSTCQSPICYSLQIQYILQICFM